MYEAEERLRLAQIERRIVTTMEKEFKTLHKATHDITLLPEWSRMRNRGNALEREIMMLRQWVAMRGFKAVRV